MENVAGSSSAASADRDAPTGKSSLKSRLFDELQKFLVITVYLWMLFALFDLYKGMILRENGVSVWAQSFTIINALIFAKVILIVQALNLGAGLQKYPLIYSALGKSLVMTMILFAFHIFEEAIRAMVKGLPLVNSIADFGGGTIRGFLTLGAIFFVTLIPFFAFREVGRVLGERALWDLFFSRRAKTFRLIQE
jgi:hypothetical protein